MKTYKHIWDDFISEENFDFACKNSQKNGKQNRQRQVRDFNEDRDENLNKVRQSVINGTFHTSLYREKTIYEPKERKVYILPYNPDRIVQHAVINVLKPIMTNLFIENTYSCIENRGQIKASLKCCEYVRNYDYCLKCDVKKFYPSINQNILSSMLHRIIKDDRFMAVVDDIIFSFKDEENPYHNIPIGNFTSQWFGNYYLTKLDNFVLHELKCGKYERFCDDFMLFSNDKAYLHDYRKKIEVFLKEELDLEFSKSDVFHTKQGVDFCGYRHFKKYKLVRKSTAKRIKQRVKYIRDNLDNNDINILESKLASVKGVTNHACTHHFMDSLGYEELEKQIKRRKTECLMN